MTFNQYYKESERDDLLAGIDRVEDYNLPLYIAGQSDGFFGVYYSVTQVQDYYDSFEEPVWEDVNELIDSLKQRVIVESTNSNDEGNFIILASYNKEALLKYVKERVLPDERAIIDFNK